MKHMFTQGPVGTRVGAKPALFSDVCETFFNRVWAPLLFNGYSCCGQTGKFYHALCPFLKKSYLFSFKYSSDEDLMCLSHVSMDVLIL